MASLSKDELEILKKVSLIRGRTVSQMLMDRGNAAKKTEEMMLQAVLQQKEIDRTRNLVEMAKEQVVLQKTIKQQSKDLLSAWSENLPLSKEFERRMGGIVTLLRAAGIESTLLVKTLGTAGIFAGGLLLGLLKQVFTQFVNLDKAAFIARKEMGMMRGEHKILRQQAEEIYKQYANLGVEAEMIYKTQKLIAIELGSTYSATKEIVTQASLLSAQFGISEDTTVKMLKHLGQMGGTTAEAQTKMIGFAGALSNAAGVPLPQVMEDVAKASEITRTMFSKVPLDMIKAAVEARRMGTSLDKMSSSSRKILNFTESIEAEMEASVLLGRPINLQLARQLAYSGKIVESNKEILRISKQMDFENMDPFQAEAFARATGKSVDEIRSMVQADRQHNEVRRMAEKQAKEGNFDLKNKIKLTDELMRSNQKVAESRSKDWEMMEKQRANQERLTSISNSWKKIIVEIGTVFFPIIDWSLKIVANIIPLIPILVNIWSLFKSIGAIANVVFKIGIPFTKWIPVIGWIITGFQFLYSLIGRFLSIDTSKGWWNTIVQGINSIGGAIYDVLIQPFVDVYNWLGKTFFGKSPSQLGLLIVNGVESVGSMLFSALTSPFKLAWDFLKNIITKIGPMFLNSVNSIGGMMFNNITAPFKKAWDWISGLFGGGKNNQPTLEKTSVKSKMASFDIPVDRPLTNKEIKSYKELDKVPVNDTVKKVTESVEQKTSSAMDIQSAILSELKSLNENLMSGKIAVNMDGQLVSTTMNRGVKFRGNYGAISG